MKVQSYLKKLSRSKYGACKLSLGELERWLIDNSAIPDSDTEPFVVNYEIYYDENDEPQFRFFVSTKKLLSLAVGVKKIHADATYKIVWQGFPVLLVGTKDLARSFHPFGVAVCTHEKSDDFKFIFSSLKTKVHELFDDVIDPEALIYDAASSIRNGFEDVFGVNKLIIMCWAHMRKAVVKKIPSFLKCKKNQNRLMNDLDKLQIAKNSQIFKKACDSFVEKWASVSKELIEYFQTFWMLLHPNWNECIKILCPSQNNALESFNNVIKTEQTFRKRYDLGQFRTVLFEMITQWSIEYVNDLKQVKNEPTIDLAMWTSSYNWARSNAKSIVIKNVTEISYEITVVESDVNSIDCTDWTSFEDFENSFAFQTATFPYPLNKDNWTLGHCDCCDFFKLFICKHIIGIALRLKFVTAPPEAKNIPIGMKRKRGRPALAARALIVQ